MAIYYHLTALAGVRYSLEGVVDAEDWIQHECGICRCTFYTRRHNSRWDSVICRAAGRANDEMAKRYIRKHYKYRSVFNANDE